MSNMILLYTNAVIQNLSQNRNNFVQLKKKYISRSFLCDFIRPKTWDKSIMFEYIGLHFYVSVNEIKHLTTFIGIL